MSSRAGWFPRCAQCHTMYRPDVDLFSGHPMWFAPRKTKSCKHDAGVEVWNGVSWDVRPLGAQK